MEEFSTAKHKLSSEDYPEFIKYMGSKSKIIDFVMEGINSVYNGGYVCDLFAGSASLSGALSQQVPVHSNDIQAYSGTIAKAYLLTSSEYISIDEIISQANDIHSKNLNSLYIEIHDYNKDVSLDEFNEIEKAQQQLIFHDFQGQWQLFTKNYSGTWWSANQCLWIDAIREVAENYKGTPSYNLILSALMYAMAYSSQGTGHYAQYRDAKTESSMKDISIYRKKSVVEYFTRKYISSINQLNHLQKLPHKITTLDYKDCLNNIDNSTVYADPPYCFVHYSRFYHALETVVLYDHPNIQVKGGRFVKGRYRENRHQSPFSIKTQVSSAFSQLFKGVRETKSNLALSYSNTGMISIEKVIELAETELGPSYDLNLLTIDHKHMTLGRRLDRDREVKECLFLAKL
ncbi:DNA adenine methylase [Marinomonas arenicola]|uniref:DNA adenine methylase n=1 Tax=Marinomonas arenicola TaxID=569601 RepID=A0ABU9G8L9_9GAMM